MEDSPYLTCCITLIAVPLGITIYAIYSLKADTALEQWASDKGYKILQKDNYYGLPPLKYGLNSRRHHPTRMFIVKVEDKNGLIQKARVVARGNKILEAKWDD
jgi:hypothetical protein